MNRITALNITFMMMKFEEKGFSVPLINYDDRYEIYDVWWCLTGSVPKEGGKQYVFQYLDYNLTADMLLCVF